MGQSAGTKPGSKGGSVFDQSAAGLGNAGKATLAAGQGYANIANNPLGSANMNTGTYKPSTVSGNFGYNPATMQGTNYTAAMQANPAAIKSGIAGYMNPYTNDVINRTGADINRQTQMGLRDIGDKAGGMGAFGGSRQGIAEGMAIGEGSKALGDISAQMRETGYNTAAGYASQDIANRMNVGAANQAALNAQRQYGATSTDAARQANMAARNAAGQYNTTNRLNVANTNAGIRNAAGQYNAGISSTNAQQAIDNRMAALAGMGGMGAQGAALAGQGMGIGQGLAGQQAQNGAQVQGINQSLISQAAGMFDQYTGQPLQSTAAILNMLSGNPLSGTGTTTQTNTPGIKSQLSGALGLAGRVVP